MIDATLLLPHLKALHVAAVAIWMAGLLALPAMLARHDRAIGQSDFSRIRQATHYGYVWAITPVAAVAIGSGLGLIFLREVFHPWMFAKLVLVTGLVALHARVGHTIVAVAETKGAHMPPDPLLANLILCLLAVAVLALVLAKPGIVGADLPAWLDHPLGRSLPFAVPSP